MSWADMTPHLPAVATAAGGLGVGGLFKTWLDHRRAARGQADGVALALVAELRARITVLEAGAVHERLLHDARMGELRHRERNIATSFDSLVMMAEMAPEHAQAFAKRVKERRAAQEREEAAEKAAVAAIASGTAVPAQLRELAA